MDGSFNRIRQVAPIALYLIGIRTVPVLTLAESLYLFRKTATKDD